MSDSDEQVCPLCCEELDISDQNFLPFAPASEQLARPNHWRRVERV